MSISSHPRIAAIAAAVPACRLAPVVIGAAVACMLLLSASRAEACPGSMKLCGGVCRYQPECGIPQQARKPVPSADERLCADARGQNSAEAWAAYLRMYPAGRCHAQATEAIVSYVDAQAEAARARAPEPKPAEEPRKERPPAQASSPPSDTVTPSLTPTRARRPLLPGSSGFYLRPDVSRRPESDVSQHGARGELAVGVALLGLGGVGVAIGAGTLLLGGDRDDAQAVGQTVTGVSAALVLAGAILTPIGARSVRVRAATAGIEELRVQPIVGPGSAGVRVSF